MGEVLGGFRLLAELGRGASGRIFLASQPSLADRPMVLKVTACGQEEHLSLARLQHMNIVPLYSEQVQRAAVCGSFACPTWGVRPWPGSSRRFRGFRPPGARACDLVEALDQIQRALPVVLPAQGPFRRYLARAPYVQAVCWIGACLADGLQYAHDRGLVHMDIKPSNVLLAGDGQPMLLDFHLARGPLDADAPAPRSLGGTPEYASPEQRSAMDSIRGGRSLPTTVDGRSDIYSLGVLLYEALAGRPRRRARLARGSASRIRRSPSASRT